MHSFCSCFKPDIWRKCCKESLKAASNSTSVNYALHAQASLSVSARIMQIYKQFSRPVNYFSLELSTASDSTNQILIPGTGKVVESTRKWYHGTAASMECLQAPLCTHLSPDHSQLVPLAPDHTRTRLARPKPNREPVCRLSTTE